MTNERITYTEKGKLDEAVTNGPAHLEFLGKKRWFLSLTRSDGTELRIWFQGKITLVEELSPIDPPDAPPTIDDDSPLRRHAKAEYPDATDGGTIRLADAIQTVFDWEQGKISGTLPDALAALAAHIDREPGTITTAPAIDDTPLMTAVFAHDLRSHAGNPFHADTPFGRPVTLVLGDATNPAPP